MRKILTVSLLLSVVLVIVLIIMSNKIAAQQVKDSPATQQIITDEYIRDVIVRARTLIQERKIDEAISLLKPLAESANDRLVAMPLNSRRKVEPGTKPIEPPASVIEYLGLAYWIKRDAENALPYIEIVATRTSPEDDSLIPGVVFAARKMLAEKKITFPDSYTINGAFIKHASDGDKICVSAERIAEVCHGKLKKEQRSDTYKLSIGDTIFSLITNDNPAPAGTIGLHAFIKQGIVMVRVDELAQIVSGINIIRDDKLRIIDIRIPVKTAKEQNKAVN